VNHGEFYCASGCESWCVMLNQWLWIMLCYACDSWWVILSKWLWIMVCYAMPEVVSYDVPGVWIMVCNAELVVVNHGVLCWAGGCESCVLCWTERLWIMLCYTDPIVFE
jgi:hypothetical protein